MTLELLPYQTVGAAFLAKKDRAGLFDVMGLGKTAQAIRALDVVQAKRVLIVCPAVVREVWMGELKKFARRPRKAIKGRDIQDLNSWMRGRVDVLIVSYEMAAKWARRMEGELIDAIVLDEAHYLKNENSIRTRALLGPGCDGRHGLCQWGVNVWFLTGTPNPNDAADVWSIMRFCRGTGLSRETFLARYYRTRQRTYSSVNSPRPEKRDELRQALASFSLRRTKQDANLQLPPIWMTTVTVDGDTQEIRDLLKDHPGLERSILEAVEKGGLSFLDAQHIATLRRLVGEAKALSYAGMVSEELHSGLDKIVIFGIHVKALAMVRDSLLTAGLRVVHLDGKKDELKIEEFQGSPNCRALISNIKRGGTGITATASAAIDMFEQDWSPAGNAQALMRVHRIGQTREVRGRFIGLANSIDEVVSATVARKTAAIAMVEGPAEYA